MTTLVIAEHDNAQLKGATLNTIAAASRLGGEVHVLVAGSGAQAVAEQAAQAARVSKVLLADAPQLAEGLAENLAAQVLAVAGGYSHILFAATASGKNVAPRVAAKLDVAQISDIIGVESAECWRGRGRGPCRRCPGAGSGPSRPGGRSTRRHRARCAALHRWPGRRRARAGRAPA
ncbi:hypothetical protein OMF40_10165, partial [Bordetella pertussis]